MTKIARVLTRWLGLCALPALPALAAAAAPFTIDDLVRLKRVSDPQASPDGTQLVYVQRETDMDADKGRTSLWLLDLAGKAAPRRLTAEPKGNDSSPRWGNDGHTLYFLSTRSGSSQVWRLTLPAATAQQVTDYPLDVGALKVAPHGERLALSMEVFPDCATLACTKERLDAREKDKAKGRLYDRLFVRHWDTWSNGTRSHLFTALLAPAGTAAAPVDVSRGFDADIPSKPFGGRPTSICSRRPPTATARRRTSPPPTLPGTGSRCSLRTAISPGSRRTGRASRRIASTS
jgi:dipeptidyl aminopeptidase/acylaminoacyl peptidase